MPDISMQFFRPGQPFDLAAYLDAVAALERGRANGMLAPLGALPPRLNLDHHKAEAKERHKRRRESDPSLMLTHAQDDLACENGFHNWRKFAEAIRDRTHRAERFGAALRARDARAVLTALESEPGSVVDVGLKATLDELMYIGNVGRYRSEAAMNTLHLVVFALATYAEPRTLAERINVIVLSDLDHEAATRVVEDRRAAAIEDPRRPGDVEYFDEALSALALYDEPEHDVELSED